MTSKSGLSVYYWLGLTVERLRWARDGEDHVAGHYRVHQRAPGEWVSTHRGRCLRVESRRSFALATAQRHHHEALRSRQIRSWGLLVVLALVVAVLAGGLWLDTVLGMITFSIAVWVLLSSLARGQAALNRSLLDPYRARESWEPPDWWNKND